MALEIDDGAITRFELKKIGVIGPGIVGMPMAAALADARIREGADSAAEVVVVQRDSPSSGWKVAAINEGRSPIGGVEPGLDRMTAEAVRRGDLRATHDVAELADADLVLVCVQTDREGDAPAYGPLMEALDGLAQALRRRPEGNLPIVVFESTLAPSSMATVVQERFARHGLEEGRDVLLGNSPNRVMPGRLLERIRSSHKLIAGLRPETAELIWRVYRHIVPAELLHRTTSLTAEVVKTLENAYRDVRIAYAAEIVRFCDSRDIDFHELRRRVNERIGREDSASDDPLAVPTGGLLVPTIGVGGHCLPKDGILLWWRLLEAGLERQSSLILHSRKINEQSPRHAVDLAERTFGSPAGGRAALLGTAYRADADDTRNSPTFGLADELMRRGYDAVLHDPHVRADDPNLVRQGYAGLFTPSLEQALGSADVVFLCVPHAAYLERLDDIRRAASNAAVLDGCNMFREPLGRATRYAGVGKGRQAPPVDLVAFVHAGFRALERGIANELQGVIEFLNERHADWRPIDSAEVRSLAATCGTGCDIVEPGPIDPVEPYDGFLPELVVMALAAPAGANA